jgi:hypothetical protein
MTQTKSHGLPTQLNSEQLSQLITPQQGSTLTQSIPFDFSRSRASEPFSPASEQSALALHTLDDLFQNFQTQLGSNLQQSPQLQALQTRYDRASNILDEYRLQTLEAGSELISTHQTEAQQLLHSTKRHLIDQAETFIQNHPELAEQLSDWQHHTSATLDRATETLSHHLKLATKEGLHSIYRGCQKAYNISDRFTQEFPSEWQRLQEKVAEHALQAKEAVQSTIGQKTPTIGIIDSGFAADEHGDKIRQTIRPLQK